MAGQEKETLENHNFADRLGDYAVHGGPGRPKGLRNRFTQIKQDMFEVWAEENGKERFREFFKGSTKDFLKALEKIVAILPKDLNIEEEKPHSNLIIIREKADHDEMERKRAKEETQGGSNG